MGMFGRRARDALRRSAVPHGRLPSWLDGALVLALLMVAPHTSAGFHDSGGFGDTSHLDLVSVMLNIAVVAPTPKARVKTATAVKPGFLRSNRTAYRMSKHSSAHERTPTDCRIASL